MNRTRDSFAVAAGAARLRRRYRAERRFRAYGLAAIGFAILSLCVLLASIVWEARSAFTKHEFDLELLVDPAVVDPTGRRDPQEIRSNVGAFSDLLRGELKSAFPDAADDPVLRRQLYRLVSTLAGDALAEETARNPSSVGAVRRVSAPVSDTADLYLKGLVTPIVETRPTSSFSLSRQGDQLVVTAPSAFAGAFASVAAFLEGEAERAEAQGAAARGALQARRDALAEAETRISAVADADVPTLRSLAARALVGADAERLRLAEAAGGLYAGGDIAALKAAIAAAAIAESRAAAEEADALLARAEKFDRRRVQAEAAGEPSAETRRIQAGAALLAHDRRRVDAMLAARNAERVATMSPDELFGEASLILGRPLAPMGQLAAAQNGEQRLSAMRLINRFEQLAAEAAVRAQTYRVAAIETEAAALRRVSDERAIALIEGGLTPAQSRLRRLQRDRLVLATSGARLADIAAPAADVSSPAAEPDNSADLAGASISDSEFLETEAAAQSGSDFGGEAAIAFALAGADRDDANLRSLLMAIVSRELEDIREDISRLERKADRLAQEAAEKRRIAGSPELPLSELTPSVLVIVGDGAVKASRLTRDSIVGSEIVAMNSADTAPAGDWRIRTLLLPEADRLVTDRQAVWADALKADGRIVRRLNMGLITQADSTYPELAGLAAGLAGSFWIMFVTLVLSMPLGVMAAIYLEEFAPRNRLTDFIEVNINNLAAVPSIVFGLLGAAVFINFLELPRSAPLVGGLVLSLITLPTIIIATRAAIGAVPPSIREGALAVGASLPQTVFHHVLPLAAPGILTGAIIGLARALGETAPLLLIGMVAFVAEPPDSMFDSATALPVLVYKWSAAAERAWQPMTSAAIIVLLVFMFAMNALAVYLRRRLERRW
jgi:phosphate ABC transporter permease subunit PstA